MSGIRERPVNPRGPMRSKKILFRFPLSSSSSCFRFCMCSSVYKQYISSVVSFLVVSRAVSRRIIFCRSRKSLDLRSLHSRIAHHLTATSMTVLHVVIASDGAREAHSAQSQYPFVRSHLRSFVLSPCESTSTQQSSDDTRAGTVKGLLIQIDSTKQVQINLNATLANGSPT